MLNILRNAMKALGKVKIPALTSRYQDVRSNVIEHRIHKVKLTKEVVVIDDSRELIDPNFIRDSGIGLILDNVIAEGYQQQLY